MGGDYGVHCCSLRAERLCALGRGDSSTSCSSGEAGGRVPAVSRGQANGPFCEGPERALGGSAGQAVPLQLCSSAPMVPRE